MILLGLVGFGCVCLGTVFLIGGGLAGDGPLLGLGALLIVLGAGLVGIAPRRAP